MPCSEKWWIAFFHNFFDISWEIIHYIYVYMHIYCNKLFKPYHTRRSAVIVNVSVAVIWSEGLDFIQLYLDTLLYVFYAFYYVEKYSWVHNTFLLNCVHT